MISWWKGHRKIPAMEWNGPRQKTCSWNESWICILDGRTLENYQFSHGKSRHWKEFH